jgi:predicted DNA-binding transcriptional regulator AlpA
MDSILTVSPTTNQRHAESVTRAVKSLIKPAPATNDPLLDTGAICADLGIDGCTHWRMVQRGEYPAPLRLGPKMKRWRLSTHEQYKASLSTESNTDHMRAARAAKIAKREARAA